MGAGGLADPPARGARTQERGGGAVGVGPCSQSAYTRVGVCGRGASCARGARTPDLSLRKVVDVCSLDARSWRHLRHTLREGRAKGCVLARARARLGAPGVGG